MNPPPQPEHHLLDFRRPGPPDFNVHRYSTGQRHDSPDYAMASLKYLIIVPEGCADRPLDDLNGQTPLAAADTPAMDNLALSGRLGTAVMTPFNLDCTDDVTLMSLLGYDPCDHPIGFAAVEAAGVGVDLPEDRWAMRISLVNAEDDILRDHATGAETSDELSHLLNDVTEALRSTLPEVAMDWQFHPGRGHRALLVDHGDRSYSQTVVHPPPLILNEPLNRHRPTGEHAELLRELIQTSRDVLADHEMNHVRRELGDAPITCCWPWGPGGPGGRWIREKLRPFTEYYEGLRGVMLCNADLPAGLASIIGWDVHRLAADAPPGKIAETALSLMDEYDCLCIHLTAIDEAAHRGDFTRQIDLLSRIDQHLIAPLANAIQSYNPWRMLIAPTHVTETATGRHVPDPVPFLMAGEMVTSVVKGVFNEAEAHEADLHIDQGSELIEYFLFGTGIGRRHE